MSLQLGLRPWVYDSCVVILQAQYVYVAVKRIHCQMLRKVNFTSRNTLSTNNLGARFLSESAFHVFPLCVYIALR